MFQTSDDDKWLISLFARHVSRPTTSSLYAEIYKRLPNDTDFTVFKKYGMEGYNFAFVRFERNYHTKNDNFANADPGSLQHHGQNAWQLLTALAEFDLSQRSPGRAIYCDVLALFVIWWPASINFGLAVGILAVTLAAGLIARRRRLFSRFKWRIFLSVAAPLFAGALAVWWMGIQGDFVDNPLPPIAAYWLLALLAVFVAAPTRRSATSKCGVRGRESGSTGTQSVCLWRGSCPEPAICFFCRARSRRLPVSSPHVGRSAVHRECFWEFAALDRSPSECSGCRYRSFFPTV